MRRTEALQGVRMIKFLDILSRYEAAEFGQLEAAELLGVGERTFRHWRQRHADDAGLLDRRLGKASGKRVPLDRKAEVEALYKTRYAGFTAKLFHEHLARDHAFAWGYTWTKTFPRSRGLALAGEAARGTSAQATAPASARHDAASALRLAQPFAWLRSSRHEWLSDQPALDLIVTLDDATGAISSAFPVAEEGTAWPCQEVFGRHGLPLSLHTDRGSLHTPEAGGKVDRTCLTQVGRALDHLGVEHIAAYSRGNASSTICRTG